MRHYEKVIITNGYNSIIPKMLSILRQHHKVSCTSFSRPSQLLKLEQNSSSVEWWYLQTDSAHRFLSPVTKDFMLSKVTKNIIVVFLIYKMTKICFILLNIFYINQNIHSTYFIRIRLITKPNLTYNPNKVHNVTPSVYNR